MAIRRRKFSCDSERELFALLTSAEGESFRKKLTGIVHRTALWRYSTGRRRPDLQAIAAMTAASGGRITIAGWLTAEDHKTAAAVGAA